MWIKSCWKTTRCSNTHIGSSLRSNDLWAMHMKCSAAEQHSNRFVLFQTGRKSRLENSLIYLNYSEAYYRAKSQPCSGCQACVWFKGLQSLAWRIFLDLQTPCTTPILGNTWKTSRFKHISIVPSSSIYIYHSAHISELSRQHASKTLHSQIIYLQYSKKKSSLQFFGDWPCRNTSEFL